MGEYVNIYDMRTHFSDYIRRVEGGETIMIARNNLPVAELRPVRPDAAEASAGFRSLRERVRAYNGGKSALAPGETLHDLIHEDHRY
jgi:prevent-host-death family protein